MHIILKLSTLIAIIFFVASCQPNTNVAEQTALTEEDKAIYLSKGKIIAMQTQKALGTNLKGAMKEGGVQNALTFCKLNAFAIKDSLSEIYKADIHRKSKKYRNPADKPNEIESEIINDYEMVSSKGASLKPIVKSIDDKHIGYYAPIMLGGLCLNCHGTVGEEVTDSTYALIQKLYPEDLATGYKVGDLRGIWSITFETN